MYEDEIESLLLSFPRARIRFEGKHDRPFSLYQIYRLLSRAFGDPLTVNTSPH